MKLIQLFEVRESDDKTGDRGGSTSLGFFKHKKDADRIAEGKGPMGSPGDIREHWAVTEDEGVTAFLLVSAGSSKPTPILILSDVQKALREQALAKLTNAEKQALGVL